MNDLFSPAGLASQILFMEFQFRTTTGVENPGVTLCLFHCARSLFFITPATRSLSITCTISDVILKVFHCPDSDVFKSQNYLFGHYVVNNHGAIMGQTQPINQKPDC